MDEPAPVMKDVDEEQQLEQQSSSPGVPLHPQANAKADSYTAFFGKHRMAAAISNLHNQINMIQVIHSPPSFKIILLMLSLELSSSSFSVETQNN